MTPNIQPLLLASGPPRPRIRAVIAAACLAGLLVGCATTGPTASDDRAAYAVVSEASERGDCAAAAAAADRLGREFAESPRLVQARLQAANTCIRASQPALARTQTAALLGGDGTTFQQDYAHYLHAIAGYGIWEIGHGAAATKPDLLSDIDAARDAVRDFGVFVDRYPDSRYRDEVLPFLIELHEGLARSEVKIARLDLERGFFEQAAARAAYVVEHYAQTNSAEEARTLRGSADARAAERPAPVTEPARVSAAPDPPPPAAPPPARAAVTRPPVAATVPAPTVAPAGQAPIPERPEAARVPPVAAVVPTPGPDSEQPRSVRSVNGSGGMEWIREQPRHFFTIQVLGSAQEWGVRAFLSRHAQGREAAWFRTERNDADWYVGIVGSYPDAEAARRAIGTLPAEMRRNQPWIRSFGSVQDVMVGS